MSADSGFQLAWRAVLAMLLLVAGAAATPVPQAGANDPGAEQRARVREGERRSHAIRQPAPAPLRAGIRQFDRAALELVTGPVLAKRGTLAGNRLTAAGAPSTCLQKSFPQSVTGSGGVSWIVCLRDMGMKALWVGPVLLQRSPGGPWITVLYEAGLAEIFVPYHVQGATQSGRLYDLQYTMQLDQVTQQDAGANGSPIALVKGTPATVVAEVRERGLGWLCKQKTMSSRRGEEFVVWGVSDAGNYDNIIQYGFRDDGAMSFRVGHTGYNNPKFPLEAHSHTSLWRVDMDLNGSDGDSAIMFSHLEPGLNGNVLQAEDLEFPFNGGVEGAVKWDPQQFSALHILDISTNSYGKHIGYEFQPVEAGAARHYGTDDLWTLNDFFVTVYDPGQLGWITAHQVPDLYLTQNINGQGVLLDDLVVWLVSSVHHDPTDEDRGANGPGVTSLHWSGFDVIPHNLFDANPLGAPPACDV